MRERAAAALQHGEDIYGVIDWENPRQVSRNLTQQPSKASQC
jgi:hypothetical protein